MTQEPENLLSEYGQILSGHASLFCYRMSHFCVKADPVALLGMEVETAKGMLTIENLCRPTLVDDYTYGFIPTDDESVPLIIKAVKEDHPEFEVDYMMCKDDEALPVTAELEQDPQYVKIVTARVPEVDSNRRDTMLDGIKVLYEGCKVQFDKCKREYSGRLARLLVNMDPVTAKQYTDSLSDVESQYTDLRDKMYADKQQEINDAYGEYMTRHEARKGQELEDAKAKGADVVQGFNMFDNIDY